MVGGEFSPELSSSTEKLPHEPQKRIRGALRRVANSSAKLFTTFRITVISFRGDRFIYFHSSVGCLRSLNELAKTVITFVFIRSKIARMKFTFALIAALCILGARAEEETPEAAAPAETTEPKTDVAEKAAVEEKVEGKICEPGALTEVACNTCICNSNGTELACTKKICVGTEGEVKPQNLPATEEKVDVKPQTLPVPEADLEKVPAAEVPAVAKDSRRRRQVIEAEDGCEPGKLFKKECNDCECPQSGKKSEAQICTTIAC
ncbi:UNVERIFIED_CONTAM: hypothetical protein PYX00_002203 [Menopon gallinae]|uniref:Pacifastin domain-containing protein n=1 Tax=Menopon gallinae TaxID=328185 RepID=A0AAW2IH41_9NEOP